jgi:factor associated with neutral sphingomyelinase activation
MLYQLAACLHVCLPACLFRLEFAAVTQLEAESMQCCVVGVSKVTKMKANMADEPYVVEKGKPSTWLFTLTYAKLDSFMPLAQEQLVMSRLPAAER